MIYKEMPIQAEGSAKGVQAQFYILDTPAEKLKIKKRPMIIVCPGGGYHMLSYREGEPVAMHFLSRGYHACVLHYSIAPVQFPSQVLEVAQVMKVIHAHAEEWHVDTENIVVQGSSAGGHLAASYGIFWNQEFVAAKTGIKTEELKPKGIMLSYPVITSDPRYAHMPSFENLLGDKYASCVKAMSLENQVTKMMPPCFLWHTAVDATVPLPNSLLMAMSLWRAGVPVELHVFPEGEHGLSLANALVEREDGSGVQAECSRWIDLADAWMDRLTRKGEQR